MKKKRKRKPQKPMTETAVVKRIATVFNRLVQRGVVVRGRFNIDLPDGTTVPCEIQGLDADGRPVGYPTISVARTLAKEVAALADRIGEASPAARRAAVNEIGRITGLDKLVEKGKRTLKGGTT